VVVDGFEPVEVEEDDRDVTAVAVLALQCQVQCVQDVTAVAPVR